MNSLEARELVNGLMFVLYLMLLFFIIIAEWRSVKGVATIVKLFSLIYLVLPMIIIHLVLFVSPNAITGIYFFDKVLHGLDLVSSLWLYFFTVIFIFLLNYFMFILKYTGSELVQRNVKPGVVEYSVVFFGVCIGIIFFLDLGDSFPVRFANLILFRSLDQSIERNAFNANTFSMMQAFAWLAVILFLCEVNKVGKTFFLLAAIFFSILLVSRRAIIFPLIITYMYYAIKNQKWYFGRVVSVAIPILLWIAYGKEFFSVVGEAGERELISGQYETIYSMLLRIFCDVGISQISSLATYMFYPYDLPRLGFDHFIAIVSKFPDGMLGFDIDWPERIVRIVTSIFTNPEDADIAPGLIGQAWIDAPFFGIIFWALFLAIQVFLVEKYLFGKFGVGSYAYGLMVVAGLILSLPINTGSLDFSLSVDIIFLSIILVCFLRLRGT